MTVTISYFGSEAAISATKISKHPDNATPESIQKADRDLVEPPQK
ncbi:hypothetical protein ACRAWF_07825 [Streptomyces sp. L7]